MRGGDGGLVPGAAGAGAAVTGAAGTGGGAPPAGPVRLVLDMARCDGHGICALRCPELIALDRFGFAGVADDVISDPALLRRARRAVAGCPEGALSVAGVPRLPGDRGGPTAGPWPPPRRHHAADS